MSRRATQATTRAEAKMKIDFITTIWATIFSAFELLGAPVFTGKSVG